MLQKFEAKYHCCENFLFQKFQSKNYETVKADNQWLADIRASGSYCTSDLCIIHNYMYDVGITNHN